MRALGVSFDGTIELGAAAAAALAVTPLTPLKAAAGWPNCLLLFSAARARRELGLGLWARAGLLWEHSRGRVERETTSSEGKGHCTTTGTDGHEQQTSRSAERLRVADE